MASFDPERTEMERIGGIVLAAAALDPTEREAYLRQVTVTEPALLAEVRRRLLLAASLPDSFLAVPAAELLAAAEQAGDQEPPVTGAERYELEDRVGQGGMATVYKAFDRQLQRPVALKLLDRGETAARDRALREAQAQARVRHDSVLEVYETGEMEGQPFIAMRWVDGPTLLALRDEASLELKVRLIAQVAEGLHAAHREGLIHRDVKPSNILVEQTPDGWKTWIADFGIAVRSDGGPAELAGTPAYLAPELLGDEAAIADRRADVYGLGVTLFELLTGTLPFQAPDLPQLLQQIREQAPPSPRQLAPTLPAELEAIILKCLEKDPEARYSSARALAEDLRRYLDGDIVEAHTATLAYRLTKFALRHRRLLWVSGTAAVLLVAALAVAAWLGVEARRANRRAELRRGQAEDLIGFMLTDLRDKLDPLGKLEILDDVGKRAMGYFASVPRAELSDEELAHRSQALYQIGDVRIRQGKLSQALAPLEESLSLAQALADRDPHNRERLFGLGQSRFWVGYVHWEQGDLTAARPQFEAYRDLSERLVRMDPRSTKYQMELAYANSNLGSLQRQALDPAGALASFRRSLVLKEKLVRTDPANKDWRFELAATHDLIGHTLMELGRLAEARAPFTASLALRQALVRQEPASFKLQNYLGTSHDSLTAWCEARGLIEEALAHARSSRQIFTALTAHDAANQLWRWKLDLSLRKEGHLLALRGEARQGIALLAGLTDTVARHAAQEPADRRWPLLLAWVHFNLGAALWEAGRGEEARPHAVQAVEGLEKLRAQTPEDRDLIRWLAKSLVLLGQIDRRRGAARASWERARQLLEPIARSSRDPEMLNPWASALLLLDRRDEARPVLAALRASGYRQPELSALCEAAGLDGAEALR